MDIVELLIVYLPFLLLFHSGLWVLFSKAGLKGWESIIPFYNIVVWLKIIRKPSWWFFLLFVPVLNLLVYTALMYGLLYSFGKRKKHQQLAGLLFGVFYIPYLALSDKTRYLKSSKVSCSGIPRSRELINYISGAFLIFIFTQLYLLKVYTTSSTSMGKTLLNGDIVSVNKIGYKQNIWVPFLQVPFTHQAVFSVTGILGYSGTQQFFEAWMPEIYKIRDNDTIIFEWFEARNGELKKNNFVRRYVAIPKDTIALSNSILFVNKHAVSLPATIHYRYKYK